MTIDERLELEAEVGGEISAGKLWTALGKGPSDTITLDLVGLEAAMMVAFADGAKWGLGEAADILDKAAAAD